MLVASFKAAQVRKEVFPAITMPQSSKVNEDRYQKYVLLTYALTGQFALYSPSNQDNNIEHSLTKFGQRAIYPFSGLLLLLEHVAVASALLGSPRARQAPELGLVVHHVAQAPLQEADARRKDHPQRKRHPHRRQIAAHNFTHLSYSVMANVPRGVVKVRFETLHTSDRSDPSTNACYDWGNDTLWPK